MRPGWITCLVWSLWLDQPEHDGLYYREMFAINTELPHRRFQVKNDSLLRDREYFPDLPSGLSASRPKQAFALTPRKIDCRYIRYSYSLDCGMQR